MFQGTGKASSGLKVRRTPVDGTEVGSIKFGMSFKGDEIVTAKDNYLWMHVIEVNGNPLDGWAAERYLEYTTIPPVDPPPVEPPPPPPAMEKKVTSAIVFYDDGSSESLYPQP